MSDRVHRLVVGLGPHLINECFTAALLDSMDISCIKAYAQNLEDRKWQQYENRDKGQHKKNRRDSAYMRAPPPRCSQCGRSHSGQCRQGSNVCYTYGDPSHYMRDCPMKDGGRMVQPTRSISVSSSLVRPLERGPQASAGRGRGRGGASSSDCS
ncbi:PREDICTED: uncharacterized protein LOC109233674 [Nicotiana attenuata]|uniref:uncharacterized protein LOC109233674 n=1 Tax=Nicotiana attenuata TaxID=49451 RepID=UPI0009058E5C|nr:PREDICTED: uncharacterized protein LOC109233674 [Nicotiana attenuata]